MDSDALRNADRCPYHVKNDSSHADVVFQFEDPPEENLFERTYTSATHFLSKFSLSSLLNGWHIYRKKDFNSLFSKIGKPSDKISELKTFLGTHYVIREPTLLKLILSQFRNEENGLFCLPDNKKIFIDGIAKDLYPDEMAAMSTEEKDLLVNEVVFTAESLHVPSIRSLAMSVLKKSLIHEYRGQIDLIAEEMLNQLTQSEKESADPKLLAYEFTITVICQLFMGYSASGSEYQKIAEALIAFGNDIGNKIIQYPATKKEAGEYTSALKTMRELIEAILNVKPASPFIAVLQESGLSACAIKLYIFLFFLAGAETTSLTIHYLLLQLGRKENEPYQEQIRIESGDDPITLKKCINEALRLNPPAFNIGRVLRRDVLLTARDRDHKLIWSKHLCKGCYLIAWIAGAGKHPDIYSNPEAFNPERFELNSGQLPWLPFAIGPHACPGQFLAKAEMESFTLAILRRFRLTLLPSCDLPTIQSKGTFTLHPDPGGEIKIKLTEL